MKLSPNKKPSAHKEPQRVALVTGTSSGFGLLTAIALAERGIRVLATMRDLHRRTALDDKIRQYCLSTQVDVLQLDVCDPTSIARCVRWAEETYSNVDILVCNAGIAIPGFLEEMLEEQWHEIFATNLYGQVGIINAVLPLMRQRRSGRIIIISSLGGRVPTPMLGAYCTSKFALEGYGETLGLELRPFGIDIVLVEPGAFRTSIWNNPLLEYEPDNDESPYATDRKKLLHFYQDYIDKHLADPWQVANCVSELATKRNTPRLRYPVGKDALFQIMLRSVLPWRIYEIVARRLVGLS